MSQPAMDTAAFAEMKEMMGESFHDLVNLSIDSLPQQLDAIENAIKTRDAETLFSSAHKLKSSCGTIGAFGLAERAETVELVGRAGSTDVAEDDLQALRDAIDEVLCLLKAELQA